MKDCPYLTGPFKQENFKQVQVPQIEYGDCIMGW